ncbi:1485_t:CDS:2 [Entrophospora sp. SA101]|nr:12753_t:CDS:2 [Entrophospora sp. SA101]CAJ0832649.1 1485_t:CDS:2 [Entrophospora sp. SA101]
MAFLVEVIRGSSRKPHCCRPGLVALRKIRQLWVFVPEITFPKQICRLEFRFQSLAISALQEMPVLSELAAKLMSIPALLAAAERNWSHFGFVHRLPDDRV